MNTLWISLWISQAIVALIMLAAGTMKIIVPRERLAQRMHWAASWPRARIKLLGAAEVAGAIGLVLPPLVHVAPILTPIAALCLAVLMVGAAQTHRRLHESIAAPLVLGVLCIAIAAARFRFGG